MAAQPLAEVFGYRIDDSSEDAQRFRRGRLCPFNNKVPSCTKDKANDPLGVCSIYHGDSITITCPIRFRENWRIVSDAATLFFPSGMRWTALTEIRLLDANDRSAGNIDVVLVSYDEQGQLIDFGALEVQAVYISGNVREPFRAYTQSIEANTSFDWEGRKSPRADFLSSSRKRLAPQLIYKGGILHSWGKKMAVAVDQAFFSELPELPRVEADAADVAWLVYDLVENTSTNRYQLTLKETVYTHFTPALREITTAYPGPEANFRKLLQRKLAEQRSGRGANTGVTLIADLFVDDDLTVDED